MCVHKNDKNLNKSRLFLTRKITSKLKTFLFVSIPNKLRFLEIQRYVFEHFYIYIFTPVYVYTCDAINPGQSNNLSSVLEGSFQTFIINKKKCGRGIISEIGDWLRARFMTPLQVLRDRGNLLPANPWEIVLQRSNDIDTLRTQQNVNLSEQEKNCKCGPKCWC